MRVNYKFHAMALGGICIAITAMYFLLAPKPPAPTADSGTKGDLFIQVYSASWGLECNEYIARELDRRARVAVDKDDAGKVIERKPLALVEPNNVLPAVSAACDTQVSCRLTANSEALGVEPYKNCSKRLQVSYRCFSFDSLRSITLEEKQTGKIDCAKDTSAPAAATSPQ